MSTVPEKSSRPEREKPAVPGDALIDLHLHSRCSDGTQSPAALASLAREAGLFAFSLTDHDTVSGLDEALKASRALGLLCLPGIELSISYGPGEIHLLGYGVDHTSRLLRDTLEVLAAERVERMEKMVSRLQSLGVPAEFEEVRAMAGGRILSRLHLALYLLRHGHVASRDEAFERYIGNGRPAYVRRRRLNLKEAIDLIVVAGGLPVYAHPGLTGRDDLIEYLVRLGLRGIEVHYPRHSPGERAKYLKICDRFDLIATGGSDFHGAGKPEIPIGESLTPPKELEKILNNIRL